MIPVVVTTNAKTAERAGMAMATLAAWHRLASAGHVSLHVVDAGADPGFWEQLPYWGLPIRPDVRIAPERSPRDRHEAARQLLADSPEPWHVWADDDCLPRQEPEWLAAAASALAYAPERWGLVSVWLSECHLHPAADPKLARPIAPIGAGGGIRFVRRGLLDLLPELPPYAPTPEVPGYDVPLCDAIVRAGYGIGVFTLPGVRATHLGVYHSSLWPGLKVVGQ